MRRLLTAAVMVLAAALVSLVVAFAALRTEPGARAAIAAFASVSGYEIATGALHVEGWTWTAEDLHMAARRGADFFQARRLTVVLAPAAVLRGRARMVVLEGFVLDLTQAPPLAGASGAPPFAELRATDGVVRGLSATLEEIRIPEIVFARAPQDGGLEIRGRLESGQDLEITWSGSAAGGGDDLAVHAEGVLRNLVRVVQADSVLGDDPTAALSFEADVSGSLGADVHATAVAKATSAALRVPVRATAVLDQSVETGETLFRADIIAEGVTEPLKLTGALGKAAAAQGVELAARWTEVKLSELSTVLSDVSRFDARAGTLSLDARATDALGSPALRLSLAMEGAAASAGTWKVGGSAALALAYADGVLSGGEDGVRAEHLEVATPAGKVAVDSLRAEPIVDTRSGGPAVRIERFAARGLAFSDGTGDLQASGLEVAGRLDAASDAEQHGSGTLSLSAPRGEVLYKRAYLDISGAPLELNVQAASNDTTWTGEGTLRLASLGEVRASGEVGRFSGYERLRLHVDASQLQAPFEKLVRETFVDAYPALAHTELTGSATLDIDIEATRSGRSAGGRLRVRDAGIDVADPALHATGITLDLPIALSSRGNDDRDAANGTLRIAEATVGNTAVGAIELPLRVRTNEIEAGTPIRILVAGGAVAVEALRAHSLMSEKPALEARVALEDLDLAALTAAAGLPHVEGTVNGPLGTVHVADASVTTEAAIDVSAFGGNIRVSDVSLHGLFSPVPALTLDAVLSGIDLRKATEAIGVGYISGIVEGEVHDLEIAAGAPVRFDAHIETVPVEGVPERISVTAIDQLAVLGGGASGGTLARSVMGLFREYRYAKLGFRCSLRNDRFVLQGVTTHEDQDFLVVGTFIPPTVNVVSHNREVAFKEMVRRLQRVMAVGRDDAARGVDVAPATEPAADVAPATDNAKPPAPASEAAPVPPQQPSQPPSQDQRTGEPR